MRAAPLVLLACWWPLGPVLAQDLKPPLAFHASFDGTTAAVAKGSGVPVQVEGTVAYRPGKVGQALLCGEGGAALRYATAGHLRPGGGTVAMWVCPLDWTGKEDEFHVFLEALDPGWLVFYRYYQGGILTLTGSDNSHYTSAASPPIDWQPGEWHHLAGTWRARRLAVYVDGKLAGRADAALLPERFAETFVVGDRPWHVPRQRQTLVDEVTLYTAPLDADAIAQAARGEPVVWTPALLTDSVVDPDTETLTVNLDAAGLVGDLGAGRRARVELVPQGQQQPLAEATVAAFPNDLASVRLSLGAAAPGAYDLRTVLLGEAGAEVARVSSPFVKPGPPVWSGNTLGLADTVLPPWTPLAVVRERAAVSCWGRDYEYGALLRQVRSGGVPLLGRPVTLAAVVGGKAVPLTGSCSVASASETTCVFTGQASATVGLTAGLRHQVEFDGFTWTDVTLEAPQPLQVEELCLSWSMPASEATLMHADRLSWSNNPAGAVAPEGFTLPFVPYLWLGNEDRGLSWYCERRQHWQTDPTKATIEVRPQGDQVAVTIRLIATPSTLQGRLDYGFGMMASPVRPYPADAMRWRMTPGVRATVDIIWPNGNMRYYGYPEPADPAAFAAKVKADHDQGIKVVPYVNLNFVSTGVPEWAYYRAHWADADRIVTPSDVAAMGYASAGTCPNRRDWQDFILYRINEMIDRYGVDGIYVDCWGPTACKCPACAWTDEAGEVQPAHPVRAYRQVMRRAYALFRQRHASPWLMIHMSSEVDLPLLSFSDAILDGEQFAPAKVGDDYLKCLPPDMFRAEFLGRNMGPVEFFLPEFRPEYTAEKTANLAAYTLLHGTHVWPIWSDGATWNRLYEVLDAFGVEGATFLPYWKSPSWAQRPPDLVSAYVGSKGALLVDVNSNPVPGEARITLDLERLGLTGLTSAVDVLRDQPLPLAGNVLTIPQQAHQGRVIWLKP